MEGFVFQRMSEHLAPQYMRAIKDTGNSLVAVLDPNDSVGGLIVIFLKLIFLRSLNALIGMWIIREEKRDAIDYISICSPNYLHDVHLRFALRNRANAICEKPLVLNPWNIERLVYVQADTGSKVKNDKPYYGLKEHASIDTNHGFILATILSQASVHDTNYFKYCTLYSRYTKQKLKMVYADKGYHGKDNRSFLSLNEFGDGIM